MFPKSEIHSDIVFGGWLVLIIFSLIIPTQVSSDATNVNILLVYDDEYSVKSFEAAVKYIKFNPSLNVVIGKMYKVFSNGTDDLVTLCENVDQARSHANFTYHSNIALDFTRHGLPSSSAKQVLKMMNLPTISGSFNQTEEDMESWTSLRDNMKNYLIHVTPPIDMISQAVRSIASFQNLEQLVFLHDNRYYVSSMSDSLSMNPAGNYTTMGLSEITCEMENQLEVINEEGSGNIFLAASPNEISSVITSGAEKINGSFKWYSFSMQPGLPRCLSKNCLSLIHLTPKFPASRKKDFLMSTGEFKTTNLMDFFYFDLTIDAILTIKKIKNEGNWLHPPRRRCAPSEPVSDDFQFNLFENFNSSDVQNDNLLGPLHIDSERVVGKNYFQFEMELNRLDFEPGTAEPSKVVKVGTWTAGFGEKELIQTTLTDLWKSE